MAKTAAHLADLPTGPERSRRSTKPPPILPAHGPPTDSGEIVQVHSRPRQLSGTDRRAACNRHPQPLTAAASQVTTKPRGRRTRRGSAPTRENRHSKGEGRRKGQDLGRIGEREQPAHEPLISRAMLAEVPLAGLSFRHHACWNPTGSQHSRRAPSSGVYALVRLGRVR